MQIIPAINCANFECVEEKLQKIEEFGAEWVHIDIADGIFTLHKTWNKPDDLLNYLKPNTQNLKPKIEVHLMVENPESVINDWIKAGVKRIIIHLEAIKNNEFKSYLKNCEIGLSINPNTPVENLIPFLNDFKFVQILAVNPGLSGQKFQLQVLEKIKFLKENHSNIIIEVDGGIDLETAKLCKEAGADILVSASYIFNSQNPKIMFEKLKTI